MDFATISSVVRWVLTAELFLGGQARLTDKLTPGIHERAMAKATGHQRYLNFVPARDEWQHSQIIGALMCSAGALIYLPRTRVPGALLSMSISLAGVYSQYRMSVSFSLPVVNTILAGIILYGT